LSPAQYKLSPPIRRIEGDTDGHLISFSQEDLRTEAVVEKKGRTFCITTSDFRNRTSVQVPCSELLADTAKAHSTAPHHANRQPLLSTRSRDSHVEAMQKCRSINPALGSRAIGPAPRVQVQVQRRNLQDVAITRTGKPILKVQGGR
jgi:hypothetical protein